MRKGLLLWLVLLIIFVLIVLIIPSCRPRTELTHEQKLELIMDIKAFEKRLGFSETENFKTYSGGTEAHHYYFYTSSTELPYSLDDSALQYGT